MVVRSSIGQELAREYNGLCLGVPASHSALQLLLGAKAEGLCTILLSTKRLYDAIYSKFHHLLDEALIVDSWRELFEDRNTRLLREKNTVLIPHASLIEYVGVDTLEDAELPIFGNRWLLRIEANWESKIRLLEKAGIPVPRTYRGPEEIDGLAIIKLPGAKGGRGYRLVTRGSHKDIPSNAIVQEYVVGVRLYTHYFYSPLLERVEVMGMDLRLEANVDGLARIPPRVLEELGLEPSYVVVANIPVVARESLLARIIEYGERFNRAVKEETKAAIIGPYSLEGVVTEKLEYIVFEFSGRIVAGTNVYTGLGSPYAFLYWSEPMWMGRRIARELREAFEKRRLIDVVT